MASASGERCRSPGRSMRNHTKALPPHRRPGFLLQPPAVLCRGLHAGAARRRAMASSTVSARQPSFSRVLPNIFELLAVARRQHDAVMPDRIAASTFSSRLDRQTRPAADLAVIAVSLASRCMGSEANEGPCTRPRASLVWQPRRARECRTSRVPRSRPEQRPRFDSDARPAHSHHTSR